MSAKTKMKLVCGSHLSSMSDDEALITWASKHFIDDIDVVMESHQGKGR
jgi:hypothetical protein